MRQRGIVALHDSERASQRRGYSRRRTKSYLRRHDASAGRKSGTKQARASDVVIEIPYRRLSRASIVKEVIWMAVAIKVRYPYHAPASRKSRPKQAGA